MSGLISLSPKASTLHDSGFEVSGAEVLRLFLLQPEAVDSIYSRLVSTTFSRLGKFTGPSASAYYTSRKP